MLNFAVLATIVLGSIAANDESRPVFLPAVAEDPNPDASIPAEGKKYIYFDLEKDKQNILYVSGDFGSNRQTMRLWVSLLEDQLDVVLASSEFHTKGKYDPSSSATHEIYNKTRNEIEIVTNITGNWTEVNFTGLVL